MIYVHLNYYVVQVTDFDRFLYENSVHTLRQCSKLDHSLVLSYLYWPSWPPLALTNEMLRNQLEHMRAMVMKKDEELFKLKNEMPLNKVGFQWYVVNNGVKKTLEIN